MNLIRQGDTTKRLILFMADAATPMAGKTGLTLAVRISKNGAAFGAGGGTVAELEGGFYSYTPAAGDVDTLGPLGVRATAAGAVDFAGVRQVVAFDPYDQSALGLVRLDAAVSTRLATASYAPPLDAGGTRGALGLASANLDVQLTGISGKTGGLTYTVAGVLDANVQRVNDVLVNGTGAPGSEWGP